MVFRSGRIKGVVVSVVAVVIVGAAGCGDGDPAADSGSGTEKEWCAQHWYSVYSSATPEGAESDFWGERVHRMFALRDPNDPIPEDPAAVVDVFREGNAAAWDAGCSLLYETWGSLSETTLAWCLDEEPPLSPSGIHHPRRAVRDAVGGDSRKVHLEQPEAFAEACRATYEAAGE